MRNHPMFSIGEYSINHDNLVQFRSRNRRRLAMFAVQPMPGVGSDGRPFLGPQAPAEIFGPPRSAAPKQGKGIRKSHIRQVGGKAVTVGQSIIKAGKATAGALSAGGKYAGQKALQGAGIAATAGGRAYEVAANNPKTAALAAGGAVLAGGAGWLATRKKRKRR